MSKYETSASQFGLVSGIRQAASDLIIQAEPRSRFAAEARKGRLYVVVEAEDDTVQGHQACQLVARVLCKAFFENDSFSITSSLRVAVLAANEALYKHNFNAPKHKRANVGLTCAVLKDTDLFLAQVAPTQAYMLVEGKLRALPTHPSWKTAHLTPTPFLPPNPLGVSLFVDPELYRCRLQADDALLLCSSNLAPLLTAGDVDALLRHPNLTEAKEQLSTFCIGHNLAECHAVLIKLVPVARSLVQTKAIADVHGSGQRQGFWQRIGRQFAGGTEAAGRTNADEQATTQADVEEEPQTRRRQQLKNERIAPADVLEAPPAQPVLPTYFAPKPRPIELGETLQQRQEQAEATRVTTLPPSAFLGEGVPEQAVPASQEPIDLSYIAELSQAQPYRSRYNRRSLTDMGLGERLMLPFQRIFQAIQTYQSHQQARRPPMYAAPAPVRRWQRLTTRPPQPRPAFPWLIFAGLVVGVTVLILYGAVLSQREADERVAQYLDQAEQLMTAVYAAPDQGRAAEQLSEAEQAMQVVRASALVTVTNPAFWLRYQALQDNYERALSSIHLRHFLNDMTVLAEHPEERGRFASLVVPPPTTSLTNTYALDAMRYIYALDGNSDVARLYRIPRQGGIPEPYLQPGDVVRNTVVGPLRAITWRLDSIVAVDQGNNGFGYYFRDADAWNSIRLGGSEIWTPRGRIDLESYDGNLYVWGAESGEILKFSSGRYGNIPQLWVEPEGLAGNDVGTSIEMAIDGYIYLLQPDGKVLVLHIGRFEREIVPGNITPPIAAVTRFFVTGGSTEGWIFLLDTLNERIIQMDKLTGAIVQQMSVQPDSALQLNQLTDLYVDMGGGRPMLYLVNGGQILEAELPAPPKPFAPVTSTPTPSP